MKPVFAHIKNTRNLGDLNCSPQQYLPQYADCKRIDVSEVDSLPRGQAVIVGGGGLFMMHTHHHFARWSETRPVIVWGAGLNYPVGAIYKDELVKSLKQCAIVGIRNNEFAFKHGFDYVPCASCLHPCFLEPKPMNNHNVFFYEHGDRKFAPESHSWKSNNFSGDLETVLACMDNSEYIVTNSYHGAFWGLQLKRRVILWKPEEFGDRFDHLKWVPRANSFDEIFEHIYHGVGVSKYYSRICRNDNLKFARKVDRYLALL